MCVTKYGIKCPTLTSTSNTDTDDSRLRECVCSTALHLQSMTDFNHICVITSNRGWVQKRVWRGCNPTKINDV